MKKKLILSLFLLSFSFTSFSQGEVGDGVQYPGVWLDLSPIQKDLEKQRQYYTEEQWKKILDQKYLTVAYSPCYVDDFKSLGFFKYNMADDQMEFLKNGKTFFLKKELGRTVRFTILKVTYKIFEHKGRLDYYLVQKDGKNSLLVKQVMKYIKPKEPKTNYDVYKPASFKRFSDEYYIALENKKLIKITRKKKDFFKIFGENSNEVQSFMKKNKLNHKSIEDLEKIVTYYNSL